MRSAGLRAVPRVKKNGRDGRARSVLPRGVRGGFQSETAMRPTDSTPSLRQALQRSTVLQARPRSGRHRLRRDSALTACTAFVTLLLLRQPRLRLTLATAFLTFLTVFLAAFLAFALVEVFFTARFVFLTARLALAFFAVFLTARFALAFFAVFLTLAFLAVFFTARFLAAFLVAMSIS